MYYSLGCLYRFNSIKLKMCLLVNWLYKSTKKVKETIAPKTPMKSASLIKINFLLKRLRYIIVNSLADQSYTSHVFM